jgi:hypothetical protein
MSSQPLDVLPLWALYPVTVSMLLAAIAGGYWFARGRPRRAPPDGAAAGVSPISGAILGLLAFLLAVVVGFGANLLQERRQAVTAEANAISTAWLRADYLDEPYRSRSRDLLRDYVDQRIRAVEPSQLDAAKARSEEIHEELWTIVDQIVRGGDTSDTTALYVSAVNDVIDLHTERVVVSLYMRVPPFLLVGLYVIALLAMFLVGMQTGYGKSRSKVALVMLALVLAVVLYLIADLDRPQEGLLQVGQKALYDVQQQLHGSP